MPIEVHLDAQLKKAQMTVAELASAIGITPANIFVLKSGRARAIRFSTLEAICEALACQPGDILSYQAREEGTFAAPPPLVGETQRI